MEPTDPQRRSNAKVWWALALTLYPGILTLAGTERAVGFALATSLLAIIASGILLGLQTGDTLGTRVIHAIPWTVASGIASLGLQLAGCSLSGYQPNIH
jgi:hypothetical protein